MNITRFAVFALCAASAGCLGYEDRSSREPSTARLTIDESPAQTTDCNELRHILVQMVVDQGRWCEDGFDGISCNDPPPSPSSDFDIVEAKCDDDACEVLKVDSTLGYAVGLTIVPRVASALLTVKARSGELEAVAEHTFSCSP